MDGGSLDGGSLVAALFEQIRLLREEAAARDAAARAEAVARDAAARAEAAARDAAARAEAEARDAAARAEAEARDAAARAEARAEAEARDAVAAARMAALRAELAALRQGRAETPLSPSYATVGAEALEALAASEGISTLPAPAADAPAAESAPAASPSELAVLRACTTERDFVAAITPLLRAARGLDAAGAGAGADPCPRVLVNSEVSPWLDALHAPLSLDQRKRPDLFVTWAPFWSGCHVAEVGAVGKLASRALQLDGCVREFYEAKRGDGELTPTDFGQLVDYHSRVRGTVRGVLFNARVFWLYQSVRHLPVSLTKCEWGARGSRAALRAFLDATPEPPLVPLLRFLCRKLAVEPRRITASGVEPAAAEAGARASAFLGAGGSARVFCVAQLAGAAELRALKVSSQLTRADLTYEFNALKNAAQAGAPVVPVVDGSLAFFVDDAGELRGGGFLLRDVCTRVDVDSAARCTAAFAALRALHASGFAHGDARVPNLLTRGSGARAELVWIDLRAAAADALESAQRADGRTLAASVLNAAPDAPPPLPVVEALAGVPSGGSEAYATLAAAVWAAYGAPARA